MFSGELAILHHETIQVVQLDLFAYQFLKKSYLTKGLEMPSIKFGRELIGNIEGAINVIRLKRRWT